MCQPWLSIVMPTFNGAPYLPQALASLEGQDLDGVEIVAVEDGSTDRTPVILDAFSRRLPLRVVPGPRRGNWVAATNAGLEAARGELVSMLHQDDGLLPGRIARVKTLMAEHPRAVLWVHAARFYDQSGRDVGPWRCPLESPSGELPSAVVVQRLLVQNFISMPGPTFRLADARRVGGLSEDLWYTADWDFWLKLAKLGPTAYLPRELGFFRVHDGSQTVRRSRELGAFREQMTAIFERHGDSVTDPNVRRAVSAAARLSVELNVFLASVLHGAGPELGPLCGVLRELSFDSLWRFGRDSRLLERLGARLRAKLGMPWDRA